ncbi:hypothetical protein ACJZ2D_015750 [Fusarium nematophilum]
MDLIRPGVRVVQQIVVVAVEWQEGEGVSLIFRHETAGPRLQHDFCAPATRLRNVWLGLVQRSTLFEMIRIVAANVGSSDLRILAFYNNSPVIPTGSPADLDAGRIGPNGMRQFGIILYAPRSVNQGTGIRLNGRRIRNLQHLVLLVGGVWALPEAPRNPLE